MVEKASESRVHCSGISIERFDSRYKIAHLRRIPSETLLTERRWTPMIRCNKGAPPAFYGSLFADYVLASAGGNRL
jgi:hypothetical protein